MSKKRLTRWSFSAWSQYTKCQYAFYMKFIMGVKDTSTSPALEYGTMVHKKQEVYLNGSVKEVPRELLMFKPELTALKRARPIVEKFWGVDPYWKPMDWGSWVVFKMDAAVEPGKLIGKDTLWIQDLKTGKQYPSHKDQASLGAVIGQAQFPKVKHVEVEFWYKDQGHIEKYAYGPKRLEKLRTYWQEQGDKLLTPQKKYLPTPSVDNCQWCSLRSDKGGKCEAWLKVKNKLRK